MHTIIRLFKENADPKNFDPELFGTKCGQLAAELPEMFFALECATLMDQCIKNMQSIFLFYRKIPHLKKYANLLLFLLEEKFYEYVNKEKECSLDNVYKLVSEDVNLIHEIYEVIESSGSPLWQSIEGFLVPLSNCDITLHHLDFTRHFFRKLNRYKEKYEMGDVAQFIRFLQHINLNTLEFFEYLVQAIEEELSSLYRKEDQLQFLHDEFLTFRKLKYLTEQPFNKRMPGIGIQVSEWIEAKNAIYYIETAIRSAIISACTNRYCVACYICA